MGDTHWVCEWAERRTWGRSTGGAGRTTMAVNVCVVTRKRRLDFIGKAVEPHPPRRTRPQRETDEDGDGFTARGVTR